MIRQLFKIKGTEKNIVPGYIITVKMDENDGDYREETLEWTVEDWEGQPDILFLAICYFGHGYSGKFSHGQDWGSYYGHHWEENEHGLGYIAQDILEENDLMLYSDWGPCHSFVSFDIKYRDIQGRYHEVEIPDIDTLFETEEEMIKKITETYEAYRNEQL